MAMTGAERAEKCRKKKEDSGIKALALQLTETERRWIQDGQDLGEYEDATEFLLEATKEYILKRKDKYVLLRVTK